MFFEASLIMLGRSDGSMVVSLNKKLGKIKLVSFLRDCYVQIPGYKDNKLNASFQFGDGPLTLRTISLNFDIYIDGYMKVNFDGFEKIIDKLGGVEVELTEEEAKYLNSTNYISKKKYRTVVPGKQTMNGNQALGYTRVRKRACITGENDDYGRTARQRMVLNAIFEKYKEKGILELLSLGEELLPLVTTNMKKEDLILILKDAVGLNLKSLETLRIPVNHGFSGVEKAPYTNVTDFLKLDFEINKSELHNFLFTKAEESPTPSASSNE